MENITVKRLPDHPQGHQAVITPDGGRWQLVIDAAGVPHLFLRVFVDAAPGWLGVDDLLPAGLSCADVIDGSAGEPCPPDEAVAAMAAYQSNPHTCPV